MIKSLSLASKIWARVIFTACCVVSQEFHPPMYFQSLINGRVNDRNYKAKPTG